MLLWNASQLWLRVHTWAWTSLVVMILPNQFYLWNTKHLATILTWLDRPVFFLAVGKGATCDQNMLTIFPSHRNILSQSNWTFAHSSVPLLTSIGGWISVGLNPPQWSCDSQTSTRFHQEWGLWWGLSALPVLPAPHSPCSNLWAWHPQAAHAPLSPDFRYYQILPE